MQLPCVPAADLLQGGGSAPATARALSTTQLQSETLRAHHTSLPHLIPGVTALLPLSDLTPSAGTRLWNGLDHPSVPAF